MDRLFSVHRLNEVGMQSAGLIAANFDELLGQLKVHVGPEMSASREFAIVKTKLEEACFYAKKAMANNPANQESQ